MLVYVYYENMNYFLLYVISTFLLLNIDNVESILFIADSNGNNEL